MCVRPECASLSVSHCIYIIVSFLLQLLRLTGAPQRRVWAIREFTSDARPNLGEEATLLPARCPYALTVLEQAVDAELAYGATLARPVGVEDARGGVSPDEANAPVGCPRETVCQATRAACGARMHYTCMPVSECHTEQ